MWFLDGAAWEHVLVQKDGTAVSVAVNNGPLTAMGTTSRGAFAWLLYDVLMDRYGLYWSAWADLVCLAGLHDASEFIYGSGSHCWPRDPSTLTCSAASDAWLDFADPVAAGQVPRSDGFTAADQAANTNAATTISLLHKIPAGTIVTALKWYILGGYATTNGKIGIWKKTGTDTGVYVLVQPFEILNATQWQSVAVNYAVPDDGYDYYVCSYTDRRAYVTTLEGQGMNIATDDMVLNATSASPATNPGRATILAWEGYKPAGLGQDVSGNGNHWDITATQSTSTPTS